VCGGVRTTEAKATEHCQLIAVESGTVMASATGCNTGDVFAFPGVMESGWRWGTVEEPHIVQALRAVAAAEHHHLVVVAEVGWVRGEEWCVGVGGCGWVKKEMHVRGVLHR
jgi:hypothetical protein